MAKASSQSTGTAIRDPRTGQVIAVRGFGSLKGRLSLRKGVDLTKPISLQSGEPARPPRSGGDTAL